MEKEFWKDIKGYEGLYQVSSLGRVRSLDRELYQQGRVQRYKGALISPYKINSGYLSVRLSKNNKKKGHTVHRLVAEAFLPNPSAHPCINHKDENKQNNIVSNLEWCSYSYNNKASSANAMKPEKYGHKISMYNKRGKFLKTFPSSHRASDEMGIARSSIVDCCKKRCHSAGGYIWRYKHEAKEKDIEPLIYYKTAPRVVWQYTNDRIFVAEYKSINSAAKATGIHAENIGACCRGLSNSAGGFIWTYEGEDVPKPKNPVIQYDLNMKQIAIYDNLTKACETIGGVSKKPGVKQCLYGKNKTAYGYIWKYANESTKDNTPKQLSLF